MEHKHVWMNVDHDTIQCRDCGEEFKPIGGPPPTYSRQPSRRGSLLRNAEMIVDGDRNVQYGDPNQDFQRTADMWSAYLGKTIFAHDVAAMMIMLKVSRIRWSPDKYDSWLDVAGYAACGWDCVSPKESESKG